MGGQCVPIQTQGDDESIQEALVVLLHSVSPKKPPPKCDALNRKVTNTFDGANNLIGIQYTDGSRVTFQVHPLNRAITMLDRAASDV